MKLTRRGVTIVIAAVLAGALGWLLGLPEVSILAAAGVALVLAAVVVVVAHRPRLTLRRVAHPNRLPAGEPCEIRLEVRNGGRRPTPVLGLRDQVSNFGVAQLVLAPIAPGAATTATYSLPTQRRGRHQIGPMRWTLEDSFGLARRTTDELGALTVVITPRTWPLLALPPAPGDEPDHGTRALTSSSTVDEEFASLRDYVAGDDIRRIHWRSTARRGTPVVRQFDVPWQRRTTLVADLRLDRHDDASFERLVSTVASVLELAARRDELIRLVTDSTPAPGFVPAADHLEDLLEHLAVLGPSRSQVTPGHLLRACTGSSASAVGRIVTCVGGLRPQERDEVDRNGRRAGLHLVVSTHGGSTDFAFRNAVAAHWDGTVALPTVWARAVTRTSTATARAVSS